MNIADILIYIKTRLDVNRRNVLVSELRNQDGVIAPRFVDNHQNMLVVAYNADMTSTGKLIANVKDMGIEASLVGM
jgi:hypothetical protein